MAGVEILDLVSGGLMLCLALLVIYFGRRNIIHWALGIHLGVRGFENILQGVNLLVDTPAVDAYHFWFAENFLAGAIGFTALAAAASYARPLQRGWVVAAWIAGAAFGLLICFPPFVTWPAPDADYLQWWRTLPSSPYEFAILVDHLTRVAAGLIVAAVAVRESRRGRRVVGFLLAAGFLVYSAQEIGGSIMRAILKDSWTFYYGVGAIGLWLIAAAAVIAWFLVVRSGPQKGQAKLLGFLLAFAIAGALIRLAINREYVASDQDFVTRLSVLVQPLLLAYAMLKFQVAELDLGIKWTLQKSTLFAMIIALGIGLTQLLGAYVEDATGSSVIGVVVTGGLIMFIAPIRQLGDKVGAAALPNAKPIDEMLAREKRTLYQEQLEYAWADGSLDIQERRRLEELRRRLTLDAEDAMRIEAKLIG